jgi:hypothetical protein
MDRARASPPAGLDKIRGRIQALRAKTIANGCTEDEALSAAAKIAELLDRYNLSLTDVELREEPCERSEFAPTRKKRIPLDGCVGPIAEFCDCRAWREKSPSGEARYVFFGLSVDVTAARNLAELVDAAVRTELGRYKESAEYRGFRHSERHLANGSFALGMVDAIAAKLTAMKAARDAGNRSGGRDLVLVKSSVVGRELARLGVELRSIDGGTRMVSPDAYDAGGAAGEVFAVEASIEARGR